jgi:hypothetical protein
MEIEEKFGDIEWLLRGERGEIIMSVRKKVLDKSLKIVRI